MGALALAAAWAVVLGWQAEARADSDSLFTLAGSTKVAFQGQGDTVATGSDFGLYLGMRLEALWLFGAEFEYTPVQHGIADDIYRPSLRATAHIHVVNFSVFDMYLGAGMAADGFGDLVDLEGASTVYRFGGGFEVIPDGHWAIGVDGYWNIAGVGYFNTRLNTSLDQEGGLPDPLTQVDSKNIEIGLALRYYL